MPKNPIESTGYSPIIPGIYQGSAPPPGSLPPNFGLLILTAEEYQPPPENFPNISIIYLPLDDKLTPLSLLEKKTISRAVKRAFDYYLTHSREILITCHMGFNRSGLVTTLLIQKILKCKMSHAILLVKRKRPGALSNSRFEMELLTWYN